ncbi:MAG: Maf family protein [Panacagrimonas sp.]
MGYDFYLASRSPRRVQLLREAGYHFDWRPADVEEIARPGESPAQYARRLAQDKAQTVLRQLGSGAAMPVVGADTDVAVDGHILGKPVDRDSAIDMLLRLSDRGHEVHSAVAVSSREQQLLDSTCTEVHFGCITRAEAEAYWDSGEPADKAGGYAIQGLAGRWVREIRGSYSGVVGLPLYETMQLLRRFGIQPKAGT